MPDVQSDVQLSILFRAAARRRGEGWSKAGLGLIQGGSRAGAAIDRQFSGPLLNAQLASPGASSGNWKQTSSGHVAAEEQSGKLHPL